MAEKSIDIAKETSVQDVLSDTKSLKATADTINTNTQSAKTDSSTIKSRMGTASDGTSSATLFGKINKLLTGAGISVADVKAYLNSTVGTSEEKSLDEMIKDVISNNRDVELTTEKVVDAGTKSTYYSDPLFTYTIPNDIEGNIQIVFSGKFSSSKGYAYIGYTINKTISSNAGYTGMDKYILFEKTTDYKTIKFQINANVGDIIRFYIWVGGGSTYPITYNDINLKYSKKLENGKMKPLGLKSVQQGVAELQSSATELIVQIATVNIDKAFVVLPTAGGSTATTARIDLNGNLLITKGSSSVSASVPWQVIEFY